jgi:hypothetical protein
MAYTDQKKASVKEAIEQYTGDYLERFTQADVIKQANDAMTANKTAIEVADAVYDYLYMNNKADIATSIAVQQCMPGDVMLILRQEIISILK